MGRPKKIKDIDIQKPTTSKIEDDPYLPKKGLFRIDEVAIYFNVDPRSVRRWIEHGILEKVDKVGGTVQIPRESILRCRFRKTIVRPV